jgi:iron-sulfur cluster repair protein YtfE (RIC family)
VGTSGARHATEYQRVIAAVGATGEPPQEDTVEELISREHALIRRHLTHMRRVADDAQHEVPLTLRNRLDAVLSFLHNDLAAHMRIEEDVLYPALDRSATAHWSSQAMRFDHEAILRLLDQIDHAVTDPKHTKEDLQRLLFVTEAVIRLHVDKEERLVMPLLNRLESDVSAVFRRRLAERRHVI